MAGGDRERMRRGRIITRTTTGVTEDTVFLQTPDTSFIHTDTWRSLRILSEFVEGVDALATAPPAVALYGADYWSGLIGWLTDRVLAEGKMSPDDLHLFHVCDTTDEVVSFIQEVLTRGRPTEPTAQEHVRPHKADAQ